MVYYSTHTDITPHEMFAAAAHTTPKWSKRLKLFENEILFLSCDNINCNVSSHFDRIPSKDANYLPQIKLLFELCMQ